MKDSEPLTNGLKSAALPTELTTHWYNFEMVPEARLELARLERRGILNPLCLPIPPLGQIERETRLELRP